MYRLNRKLIALVAMVCQSIAVAPHWGAAAAGEVGQAAEASSTLGHLHYESRPHPTTDNQARFATSRTSDIKLPLPEETDAFTFAVFGDRTGGPPEGIEILKQAVGDANLFEPDLVMTVGDLVQGYNNTEEWLPQMREYKSVMNELLCPWFPVAGNHDVYWRGEGSPKLQHEHNYEMHFGPLWYAFEHKNCWFIALFSDEGDPESGRKSFNEPELQTMSPAQFDWLKNVLDRAGGADHVFVFLHHPRWLGGNYGDDWQRVHQALVDAGNVRAVFAGHIHRMRYDGPRDGIEYVTLATVGGGQSEISPDAGFLHHYNLITVRKQQIAMASVPVGAAMDVREVTGTVSDDILLIARTPPNFPESPAVAINGSTSAPAVIELFNPSSQPVEYEVHLDPGDAHWMARPDHIHRKLYAGQRTSIPIQLKSLKVDGRATYEAPKLQVHADYLGKAARFAVIDRTYPIPVRFQLPTPPRPETDLAISVGEGKYLAVEDAALDLPDGPMTLECWCKPNSFSQRQGLVAKTEVSEYGIFVSGGIPYFTIHLDGNYVQPTNLDVALSAGKWSHIAGVYDGKEVRTYLDGRLVARGPGQGKRTTNRLPLIIGADLDEVGTATSSFDGAIDAVRLSKVARYAGDSFTPERRWSADQSTVALYNFDAMFGPLAYDESASKAHARSYGEPELVEVE